MHSVRSPKIGQFRRRKIRIGSNHVTRIIASFLQQDSVTQQIGDAKWRQAMLSFAKQVSWTAQLEVHFRQFEPVITFNEHL